MDLTGEETLPSNQGSIKAQAKFTYFRPSICWSRRRLDKMSSKKSFRLLQDVLEDKKLLRWRCFQDMSWSRLADFLENNNMFTTICTCLCYKEHVSFNWRSADSATKHNMFYLASLYLTNLKRIQDKSKIWCRGTSSIKQILIQHCWASKAIKTKF